MGKRLVGGVFLLNLCAISLNLTAGEVDIQNEEVLDQLKDLRNFIDEKRDFSKGFKDLKPVLVQYRSSASKIDGIVPCNLSFNTDALHLSIAGKSVQADESVIDIVINVVFELQEYVGYRIKSAKLYCSQDVTNNVKFEVSNIKALNDDQLNLLKVGDIVAKVTDEQKHMYIVTYKQENHGICLSYFDASMVETQSYDYTDDHWVYNSEDKTIFADLGGLPEVTTDDDGKVLGVDGGVWLPRSLVGKFVRIMLAPSSTTLTDEQIEQLGGGAFIEGEIFGYKNPIMLPLINSISGGTKKFGFYIGMKLTAGYGYGDSAHLGIYTVENKNIVFRDPNISFEVNINSFGDIFLQLNKKRIPSYSKGFYFYDGIDLKWYNPVAVTGITSGDDLAGVQDNLVNAMKDHLDVEINGHRCRFEKDDGTYVIYSWKDEVDGGVNLQVNMISLLIASPNTISFNLMKFTPVI